MLIGEIVWGLLGLRMLAGAVGVGNAVRRLPIARGEGAPEGYRAVLGPGVNCADGSLEAAMAWAAAQGLDVVHLMPEEAPLGYAWMAGFLLDRAGRDDDWLEARHATGYATIVSTDVVERAGFDVPDRLSDPAELVVLQKKLARYGKSGVAVLPGSRLDGPDPFADRAVLEESLNADQALILGPPLILSLLLAGPLVTDFAGAIALTLYAAQQALALSPRGRVKVPAWSWFLSPVTRVPWQLWRWLKTLVAPSRRLRRAEAEALRPVYAELMKDGLDPFFEPQAEVCPLCGGSELKQSLKTDDFWQGKPGTFTVDRCLACDHLFQNPRLSVAGLGFYYRDFYDGLGGEDVETLFGSASQPYADRAAMVTRLAQPTSWLDVGCGHGHFCARGKELLPDCSFSGLDLSDGVDDAHRRGWLDEGHRGLFVDLAPQMADRYDAVSMSHYLEHTLDPRAEIAAAATVLRPGGHLVIEVPDPESWVGRLLGPLWIPWFQPQHLHFVSVGNLNKLFDEHGLEAVEWHRREAHIPSDVLFALWSILRRIAPVPGMPWDPPAGPLKRGWYGLVWTAGVFGLVCAVLLDRITAPVVAATGGSNTYRVVARKR